MANKMQWKKRKTSPFVMFRLEPLYNKDLGTMEIILQ